MIDHDIATNNYTKIQAIVAPSPDREKWAAAFFDSEILAARGRARSKRGTFEKDLQWNSGVEQQAAPTPQGEERGQDEAEGKEARAGQREIKPTPAPPQHDGRRAQEGGAVQLGSERAGRPLMTEHAAASRAGPDCEWNGQHHGQPGVKQGGATGYLEKEACAMSTPNPHL